MAKVAKRRGRWVLDYYDNTGKRRWKTMRAGATRKAAELELARILKDLSTGAFVPDSDRPTFETVSGLWLNSKKLKVRQSTWATYEGHLKNHFEAIKPLRVDRITVSTVEKFIADKMAAGVSVPLLKKILITFGGIMGYAEKHSYAFRNPVRQAEKPSTKGIVAESQVRVLSATQINKVLKAIKDPKYRMLTRLAAASGLRQGELAGLKWQDIDFDACQIAVERTFNNNRWYMPKSRHSVRRVDVGVSTMNELKKWRLMCPPTDLDLVFPNDTGGGPFAHSVFYRRHFWPALKKAKMSGFRFHDLRHSYASALIEQGETIVYISRQLGHADAAITLKVYAHLMRSENPEAARKLDENLFGSSMVADDQKGET